MKIDEYDDLDEIELDDDDIEFDRRLSSGLKISETSEKKKTENTEVSALRELFSYIKIIVAAVIIAFICNHYVIVNAKVPTGSMKNTIMEGDRLIGLRLSYLFNDPKRLDVVIFKYPDDETQIYVKRVIGLPGDIVEIKLGKVYVNGTMLDEPYIREPMVSNSEEITFCVPEGHYFMMGDNRNNSLDSRYWVNTYVAKDKIIARAVFKYYDGMELIK